MSRSDGRPNRGWARRNLDFRKADFRYCHQAGPKGSKEYNKGPLSTGRFKAHGKKEDDELFKRLGDVLTDADDALIVGLMARIGPGDVTLYHDMISAKEKDLGVNL